MRAVVQLVSKASVRVKEKQVSQIGPGLLVLLGVHRDDTEKDAAMLAEKIANLRVFPDQDRLMNLSVLDVKGEILVVSQFTLYGDCRKGRRPSYSSAAPPELANRLYEMFMAKVKKIGIPVAAGEFQALMDVELVNQGPVTLLLDSTKLF
jgi:D-tyrosyl-tRNA(Tyr) deacylase